MLRLALLALLVPLVGCEMYGVPAASGGAAPEPDLSGATEATGTLADGDATRPTGQLRDDVATVAVPPGGSLSVELTSSAFDPYLMVEVVGTDQVLVNDDFNGSRQRSVIVQPNPTDEAVDARIVASAYSAASRGGYAVRYVVRDAPAPVVGAALAMGTTSGSLGTSSERHPITLSSDPRPTDVYTVSLDAGEAVVARMESADFDTYLTVERGGTVVARNDDFGGDRSVSQVSFTPTVTGDYTVYAGSFSAQGAGDYTLRLGPSAAEAQPTPALPTAADESRIQGTISDADARVPLVSSGAARHADAYDVELRAGQTLEVVMEASAFDTYLKLVRGDAFVARNDDAGSVRRSAIRHTATVSGTYTVYAGSFNDAGRGDYTLTVSVD